MFYTFVFVMGFKEGMIMGLPDNIRKIVKEQFGVLKNNVRLAVFTQTFECQYCKETREMAEELSTLSDKLATEVYDFEKDRDKVDSYGIDRIPAIAVLGERDFGIRFYGIPSGYEFGSLLESIKLVSTANTKLSPSTKEFLDGLSKDIHLQVFVSPTCPYCPIAVIKAHELAFYSDKVKADMIEVVEFPHMTIKYNVQGVPRTVINETFFVEGAVPEAVLVQKLKEAVT
jgi:glutaredoxin-like protein